MAGLLPHGLPPPLPPQNPPHAAAAAAKPLTAAVAAMQPLPATATMAGGAAGGSDLELSGESICVSVALACRIGFGE